MIVDTSPEHDPSVAEMRGLSTDPAMDVETAHIHGVTKVLIANNIIYNINPFLSFPHLMPNL